jgi:predicted dehydrogenase
MNTSVADAGAQTASIGSPPARSLRYDIVGCGAVVQAYHVPVVAQFVRRGLVTVRGCYDTDDRAANLVASMLGAATCGLRPEVDATAPVDAAIIATPPESHAEIAKAYLTAGKHVFVEKPFTVSYSDARNLVMSAKHTRRRLLVGHFRRFYPSLQNARRLLQVDALGEITSVEATEGARWAWPARSSYFVNDPHGGVLWDTGSHVLDMVLFVLSLDMSDSQVRLSVRSVERTPVQEPSHDLRASFELSGAGTPLEVHLHVSRMEALAGCIKVVGTHGTLVIPTSFAGASILYRGGAQFTVTDGPVGLIPCDSLGCFHLEHQDFLTSCADLTGLSSILDASRFITLSAILERLATFSANQT